MKYSFTVGNLFYIKKDKAGFRNITNWIVKNIEPPEIPFTKSVSSIITHILIEMENSSTSDEALLKASGYQLTEWISLLNNLVNANISVEDACNKIKMMIDNV